MGAVFNVVPPGANVRYDDTPQSWKALISTTPFTGIRIAPGASAIYPQVVPASGSPWPDNPALGPWLFMPDPHGFHLNTINAGATASENEDGTGASYPLTVGAVDTTTLFGNPITVTVTNPTDRTLYLQSLSGTLTRWCAGGILPPTAPVSAPAQISPTATLPPLLPPTTPAPVVQRKLLDKANTFTAELDREEQYGDFGTVRLGQRINVTANSEGMRFGMVGRGHILTRRKWDWVAQMTSGGPQTTFTETLTIEHIPGTLLPGAGTSNAAQDALGTGAEISAYARWDDPAAGWDRGDWMDG